MVKIGIPRELKDHETRVALTPEAVSRLAEAGHPVFVQRGAGILSGYPDRAYRRAGATLVASAREIYSRSDLVVKVKEPLPEEYARLRPGLALFCYLHLAANPALLRALLKNRVSALGFETLIDARGQTPLLQPMSEIAGRLSVLLGSQYLRSDLGGKGVLLSPTKGVAAGRVVIVGGGNVGRSAAESALGLGAEVTVFDLFPEKIKIKPFRSAKAEILKPEPRLLLERIRRADLLIGAIYTPGAKAARVIKNGMVQAMEKGSVFVDVAIDQGGSSETSRPTRIGSPVYLRHGVIHCAIPNLPSLAGRSATQALSSHILPYVARLAARLPREAWLEDPELLSAANVHQGKILHPRLRKNPA